MSPPRALVSWSTGKDSAWALHLARLEGTVEIAGLLTTVTEPYHRVSMHGVRESLLAAQVSRLGLPLHTVRLPAPCSNEAYQERMGRALAEHRRRGITHVVFGDLFLEDIREYREARMAEVGMTPVFPVWGLDTGELARTMIAGGLEAYVTVVDPSQADPDLAGRRFDGALLDELPPGVDPCGERGEFHTVVTAGPMLESPIPVSLGAVVEREGFVFADVTPR